MSLRSTLHGPLPAKRKYLVLAAILLFAAALAVAGAKILEEAFENGLMDFDRTVLFALRHQDNPAHPIGPYWLQHAARDVTSLGSYAIIALITAAALGFFLLKRQAADALLLASAVAGGALISHGLKDLIERPRPAIVPDIAPMSYSFPSGHAFLSAVTFLTLGALAARAQQTNALKAYVLGIAIFLTVLVGISRVYLGVHWPTDVLGGWCAGAAWAFFCWFAAGKVKSPPQS